MRTPFDSPQAELAWMFLQCLTDGDSDECFALLSDDFTYWSITARTSADKAALRQEIDRRRNQVEVTLDLIGSVTDGDSVVVEAHGYGVSADGTRFDSPYVFIFETRDGMIVSLREYSDARAAPEALPASNLTGASVRRR